MPEPRRRNDIESYIKFIYSIDENAYTGWKMYDGHIDSVRDLIAAILVRMKSKLASNSSDDEDEVRSYLSVMDEAVKWCPDRQIAELNVLYSALYGTKESLGSLQSFIRNQIAALKGYIFETAVTPGTGTQNVACAEPLEA